MRELVKCGARRLDVERLLLRLAEDLGEEVWQQAPEEEVGVGDGQRAALAVARWAGMGARRLGADDEEPVLPEEARAAACGDRVDVELGRLDGDAGGGGFEDVLVTAVSVTGYVCAGASLLHRLDVDLETR